MAQVLVQYPSGPAFDKDYYLETHMPLVEKTWKPFGLISWEILSFPADAPYQITAVLKWKTTDEFKTAAAHEDAKAVFDDIPKFTSAKPILLIGDVIGGNI